MAPEGPPAAGCDGGDTGLSRNAATFAALRRSRRPVRIESDYQLWEFTSQSNDQK